MKKVLTGKKLLPCLIHDGWYTILKDDGTFVVYDTTNTIDPNVESRYAHLKDRVNFDEIPFLAALEQFKKKREEERIKREEKIKADEEQARLTEIERVSSLTERIRGCETPVELAETFGLKIVELAGHWSDLYEGRSRYGILMSDRADFEIVSIAVDVHDGDGEYGEAKNRAGEHHWTFGGNYYDLKEYQEALARHFNSDRYFFHSQECDAEFYLDRIKEAEDIDDVKKIIRKYDELEEGYYDNSGGLRISQSDLDDPDLTGYSEDVYTYRFCYDVGRKYSWSEPHENVDEE